MKPVNQLAKNQFSIETDGKTTAKYLNQILSMHTSINIYKKI